MNEPRWIKFVEVGKERNKPVFGVFNKGKGTPLGVVQWFSRWNCYIFSPEPETIYSEDCLRDIAAFCAEKKMP